MNASTAIKMPHHPNALIILHSHSQSEIDFHGRTAIEENTAQTKTSLHDPAHGKRGGGWHGMRFRGGKRKRAMTHGRKPTWMRHPLNHLAPTKTYIHAQQIRCLPSFSLLRAVCLHLTRPPPLIRLLSPKQPPHIKRLSSAVRLLRFDLTLGSADRLPTRRQSTS